MSSTVKASAVKKIHDSVDQIKIYATEGDIYTVSLEVNGDDLTVCNDANQPMLYKSLALAKAAFKKCTSAKTQVIVAQPYDEMIGHTHETPR